MRHLLHIELVLLLIISMSVAKTSRRATYPPTGLISQLADLLHFDRVELLCSHDSDEGMQVHGGTGSIQYVNVVVQCNGW